MRSRDQPLAPYSLLPAPKPPELLVRLVEGLDGHGPEPLMQRGELAKPSRAEFGSSPSALKASLIWSTFSQRLPVRAFQRA